MGTRTHPIFNNFTLGEISPRLHAAVTWEKYPRGCVTLENMLIQPQGGVTRRPGSRFCGEVKDSTKATRLLPFVQSDTVRYVVEAGHQYFRFYNMDGTRLEVASVPVEIVTPFQASQLFSIHYGQIGDTLVLTHGAHHPKGLSRYPNGWRLRDLPFDPPPSKEFGTRTTGITLTPAAVTGANIQMDASAGIFLGSDVGRDILVTANGSQATIVAVDSATRVHANIVADFPDLVAVPGGDWKIDGSPMATLTPSAASPIAATITLTLSANGWRAGDVGKYVLLSGGLCKITAYTTALAVTAQILRELYGTTAQPPTAWGLEEDAWSATNGYPSTVGFFEGRMLLAPSTADPDAIFMSASNSFLDYGLGSTDDAAIVVKAGTGMQNTIRWFSPRRTLLMGTASDEFSISAQSDAVLTGKNVRIRPATPHGSCQIMPIRAEHATLFVTDNRRLVREIAYAYEVDDYRSPDLLSIAEHLTTTGTIVDMAYQRPPESMLWAPRSDGVLLCCAYLRDQDIVGWSRIVTEGAIESVCTVPSSDGTTENVWWIVQRNGKRYVEFLDATTPLHPGLPPGLLTDSAVVYSGAPTNTMTGLGHLEGRTVQIVGDGAVYPPKTVVAGQVTLEYPPASVIEAGLLFTATLMPVPPEVPSGGTSLGLPKSWGNIVVRLKDTAGVTINGETVPFRKAGDPMGSPPSLFTGFKRVASLGWGPEGTVTVQQMQPLPLTVLAITGTLAVGD